MSAQPDNARQCASCKNVLPRGTCAEPVKAGLFAPDHGFGIAWAPEGHAARCEAYAGAAADQEVAYG